MNTRLQKETWKREDTSSPVYGARLRKRIVLSGPCIQILSYFLQMTTISVSSREIWEIIKIDCTCFQILDADIMISKEHPVRPLKKVRGLRLMLCSNALCKKYL